MEKQKSIFKSENKEKNQASKKVSSNVKFIILAVILISLFCFAITPVSLQNDTFYSIKIGEHIQNVGIDMQDPFSWHEGLSYTYPHWLYDLLTYWIYAAFNMDGIYIVTCILSCILGISIYYVNYKINKNNLISFLLAVGVMYLIKSYVAARAQLVTFILFTWTVYFIERFLQTKKWRYGVFLILISLAIANLHVAVWPFFFVLFLPYIGEYIIAALGDTILYKKISLKILKLRYSILKKKSAEEKAGKVLEKINELESRVAKIKNVREQNIKEPYKIKIERNKNIKFLILIMIICALMGLITPTGDTPYTYLYKTMIGNTTQNINEHLPMTLINEDNILCVLIIFLAVLIFTKAKIRLCDLFMLCGLTFLMLMTQRQASIFVIICSVILNRLIYSWITSQVKDFDDRVLNFAMNGFGVFMLSSVIIMFCMYFIKPKLNQTYIDENTYPVKMSDWILEYFEREQIDLSEVRLFNEYNYGSYLLFRGIPVFIDSRCDLYAPEYNPGVSIFDDFIASSNLNDWFEIRLAKYNITHMILYKDSKMNMIIERGNLDGYKLLKQDENFVFYEITD